MMGSLSGGLATMGCGVPYALAAKFALSRPAGHRPGRRRRHADELASTALITIAKYWQQWADPRLVVLVLNNRDLNMVTWEQRGTAGDPKFDASQDAARLSLCRYARAARPARHPRRPARADVGPAWDEALAADRPVVLEMVTDPNVPPLPPHVTVKQAQVLHVGAAARATRRRWRR